MLRGGFLEDRHSKGDISRCVKEVKKEVDERSESGAHGDHTGRNASPSSVQVDMRCRRVCCLNILK
jgi:hypothetical protein